MQWFLKVLRQYFDFAGRARRKEFWMFMLIATIISLVLARLDSAFGLAGHGVIGDGPINDIYQILIFVPSMAVGARRLHDIGRSGWWQLAFLVPTLLVGIGAAEATQGSPITLFIGLATFVAILIWLIVWWASPGKPERNKWGMSPNQASQTTYTN